MNTTDRTPNPPSGFWKTAFIFGGLAGLLIIAMMITSYSIFGMHSSATSMTVGFLLMFFILSLIFFGMKRFRDRDQGGVIKFTKALMLGLAMSVFAGFIYVIVWEIYVAKTGNSFILHYTDHLIELQKAKGVSGEALTEFTEKMTTMKTNYARPTYRIPLTFSEIFPVGFIVALISALFLHNPKLWARRS
jgi:hypothetical protein